MPRRTPRLQQVPQLLLLLAAIAGRREKHPRREIVNADSVRRAHRLRLTVAAAPCASGWRETPRVVLLPSSTGRDMADHVTLTTADLRPGTADDGPVTPRAERPRRRSFTAEDQLQVLAEYD